jgi:hypothetical protein
MHAVGGDGFLYERYYCAHCPLEPSSQWNRYSTKSGVRVHLRDAHELDEKKLTEGRDYYQGWQARQVWGRRQKEAEEWGEKAALVFAQPGYNAEDFLIDCGPITGGSRLDYDLDPE